MINQIARLRKTISTECFRHGVTHLETKLQMEDIIRK